MLTTGAIAGIVVGVLSAAMFGGIAVLIYSKRRARQNLLRPGSVGSRPEADDKCHEAPCADSSQRYLRPPGSREQHLAGVVHVLLSGTFAKMKGLLPRLHPQNVDHNFVVQREIL